MMNANAVARNYHRLAPEERFRLILAASGRGDAAERDRLARSAGRIGLSFQDHWPYAVAFGRVSLMTFIDLQEDAALYTDAFIHLEDAGDLSGDEDAGEGASGTGDTEGGPASADDEAEDDLGLALAAGFLLRVKADGWKLFCERLNVPPFMMWEGLPGFGRLRRALALAEKVAFVPEGFLSWMNAVGRRLGEPELTESPLTVEGVAAALEDVFRDRVRWWGGEAR
jgi:hypothetical protein